MDDQIVLNKKEIEARIVVLRNEHDRLLSTLGQVQTAAVQRETQVYLLTLLLEGKLEGDKKDDKGN